MGAKAGNIQLASQVGFQYWLEEDTAVTGIYTGQHGRAASAWTFYCILCIYIYTFYSNVWELWWTRECTMVATLLVGVTAGCPGALGDTAIVPTIPNTATTGFPDSPHELPADDSFRVDQNYEVPKDPPYSNWRKEPCQRRPIYPWTRPPSLTLWSPLAARGGSPSSSTAWATTMS